jgi:hypothetical protein
MAPKLLRDELFQNSPTILLFLPALGGTGVTNNDRCGKLLRA